MKVMGLVEFPSCKQLSLVLYRRLIILWQTSLRQWSVTVVRVLRVQWRSMMNSFHWPLTVQWLFYCLMFQSLI